MMPNNESVISKIRLPDEHVIAIMAGSQYQPSKIKMRALKNLIKTFENSLEECDKTLSEFYKHGGVVKQEIDGYFSFSHGLAFEICVSEEDVDYESYIEILEAAKAYKRRIALTKAVKKAEAAIDMIDEDMSLKGTSEFAQSVRSDHRFTASLLDGTELEDEENDEEDKEEAEE